jgi:hypothetical protein
MVTDFGNWSLNYSSVVKYRLAVHDFILTARICDVWKVHKMQSLAFMFDIVSGRTCVCFQ